MSTFSLLLFPARNNGYFLSSASSSYPLKRDCGQKRWARTQATRNMCNEQLVTQHTCCNKKCNDICVCLRAATTFEQEGIKVFLGDQLFLSPIFASMKAFAGVSPDALLLFSAPLKRAPSSPRLSQPFPPAAFFSMQARPPISFPLQPEQHTNG
jgi:hypothetical protein